MSDNQRSEIIERLRDVFVDVGLEATAIPARGRIYIDGHDWHAEVSVYLDPNQEAR
jgi:hypothetical protein